MPSDISRAINDAVVRRLAGDGVYQRGRDYFINGQVESLDADAESVRAMVRGTDDYTVILSSDEGILDYSCDCPQGVDGEFCKHCVAAALAWLNREGSPAKGKARGKGKAPTLAAAAKILLAEDHDTVVRTVIGWANDDARLRERLLLFAARQAGPESGAAEAGRAFERATRVRGFVDYHEAPGWARGVNRAIDSIAQLVEAGQGASVIELCESALQQLATAAGAIDDSDGHLTMLRDRLQDIHFRACQQARPDPLPLARRLFDWELHGELDIFYGAAERYAKILGATGLKEYRRFAEAEWEKAPVRTTGDTESEWGWRFRITQIMEALARASGGIEEIVAVMSRDLSNAYQYLRIAGVYREAGQHDQALAWAEKGLQAFPEGTDRRLREFAAEEYHRRSRHEEAMKLIWAEFHERPFLETYQTLERHAKIAGIWPEWRGRALAEIRARIAKAKEESRGRAWRRWMQLNDDHSRLVEIFLYERDDEAAWREANEGGCSHALWLDLAAAREREHPADVAPVYLKLAGAAVAAVNNGRYDDTVGLLIKAAAVMKRMDRGAEFVRNLEALREKYKLKRNFVKLIEKNRRSLYIP